MGVHAYMHIQVTGNDRVGLATSPRMHSLHKHVVYSAHISVTGPNNWKDWKKNKKNRLLPVRKKDEEEFAKPLICFHSQTIKFWFMEILFDLWFWSQMVNMPGTKPRTGTVWRYFTKYDPVGAYWIKKPANVDRFLLGENAELKLSHLVFY